MPYSLSSAALIAQVLGWVPLIPLEPSPPSRMFNPATRPSPFDFARFTCVAAQLEADDAVFDRNIAQPASRFT